MIRVLSYARTLTMARVSLLATAVSFCLVLAGTHSSAAANPPLPFHCQVTATWDNIFNGLFAPPANFVGGGPATHMGMTTQHGTLYLGAPDANGMAPGYGSVTIVGANGDSLTLDYVGVLNAVTGEGIGTYIFTSGTGRFANVSGQ